jgi:hypothetical protein
MRLTSEFWVAALVRRCFGENAFAAVVSKGAAEAGAIYIVLDRLDGTIDLFGPAPQSAFDDDHAGQRLFERLLDRADREAVTARLASEARMDPDIWVVEVEDREARLFWDVMENT